MPNHITNRLTIKSNTARVNEILEHIKCEKENEDDEVYGIGTIDFNKIVPMPKDLNIESNGDLMPLENRFSAREPFKGVMDSIKSHFTSGDEHSEKRLQNFLKGCENYVRYGFATWYEWSRQNWGTKWNAYGQPDKRNTENTIYFQTAWACPIEIITVLSKSYPDVEFEIAWADEDLGHNIGIATFVSGEKISENKPEGGSLAAKKMYFEITQDTLEQHNMNENYEYINED